MVALWLRNKMNVKIKPEFIYAFTEDGLRLQGNHWESTGNKDICVICVHGMSGNIIENYFAVVLGETLSKDKIGFIYGHNRGYNHINDIKTKEKTDEGYKTKRIGVTYERFEECIFDIDLWISEAKRLGYKKIILMGHSLGCNKVIYYFSNKKPSNVISVILASSPDMVGLLKSPKYQPNYEKLLNEAKENVKKGQPRKILSSLLWDWYHLSSQTFLDLGEEGCLADNLPLLRNPEHFKELESINVPILAFLGEKDDIAIRSLKEDLDLIKSKAINCPKFTSKILDKANHNYDDEENELSKMILDWIKQEF